MASAIEPEKVEGKRFFLPHTVVIPPSSAFPYCLSSCPLYSESFFSLMYYGEKDRWGEGVNIP